MPLTSPAKNTPQSRTKELFKFASPILLGQMGQMLIGAGDVFVAAKHSATMLAAIAVANSFSSFIFVFFLGLLLGIGPILSKKRGQGDHGEDYLMTCLMYGLIVSLFAVVTVIAMTLLIPFIGVEPKLVPMAQGYLVWYSWSFIGTFVYFATREFLQAREDVMFVNAVAMVAVFVNIVLNYLLVFGMGQSLPTASRAWRSPVSLLEPA